VSDRVERGGRERAGEARRVEPVDVMMEKKASSIAVFPPSARQF